MLRSCALISIRKKYRITRRNPDFGDGTKLRFLARDSMLSALYAIANPSVCPSQGWISRKRLKLGSCSFHHTVPSSLWFSRDKFHPEILTGSPGAAASNNGRFGETNYFRSSNAFARWLHKFDLLSQLRYLTSNSIARWQHCRALTVASAALSCFAEGFITKTFVHIFANY